MKQRWRRSLIEFFVAVYCGTAVDAEVKPHALFSEGAVLQQRVKIPVWGTAKDGEKVTVEFQKQKLSTIATNGQWKVVLKPLRAGGPFTLKIQGAGTLVDSIEKGFLLKIEGDNTIVRTNIFVGEVWVCSGQSNMQMTLGTCANGKEAIAGSQDPMLRLFTVPRVSSDKPERDIKSAWEQCGPETVGGFSGVAYYFGRDLRKALKVPIGLIHSSWGGSPAETWTSRAGLEQDPALRSVIEGYEKARQEYAQKLEQYTKAERELKLGYEAAVETAKAEGKPPPKPPSPPSDPALNAHRPTALYNAMIAPLQPFAIKGAIWYQGESNAGRAFQYRTLFPAMIRSWRESWGQGDFPFLFVQLAPHTRILPEPGESQWAELREAQLLTTRTVSKTAMAVITDAGDENDIHPKRKEPVGARLALAARAIAYGERIEYSGPIYDSMKIKADRVRLAFKHLDGGLIVKGDELKGFTIAGQDKKFMNAKAEVQGNEVVVYSSQITKPVAVRFGWANYPVVNLYNKAGLPASPFRTDDFPLTTAPK